MTENPEWFEVDFDDEDDEDLTSDDLAYVFTCFKCRVLLAADDLANIRVAMQEHTHDNHDNQHESKGNDSAVGPKS